MRCGCTSTPRFATVAYAAAICTGVTATPWPIGTLPIVEPDHSSGRSTKPWPSAGDGLPVSPPRGPAHEARALGGERDPRLRAEAEAPHPLVETRPPELLGERDRADVR